MLFHFLRSTPLLCTTALLIGTLVGCDANDEAPTAQRTAAPAESAKNTMKSAAPPASQKTSSHYLVRLGYTQGAGVRVVAARSVGQAFQADKGESWKRRQFRIAIYDASGRMIHQDGIDDPALVRTPPANQQRDAVGDQENEPAAIRMEGEAQWLMHLPRETARIEVYRLLPGKDTSVQLVDTSYEKIGEASFDASSVKEGN